MKRFSSLSSKVLMGFLCVFFLFAGVASAGVTVYAEGAYTATDLVVYIYADITAPNLCSYGVKLSYPAGLTAVSAEKNGTVWYFTGETYMDPEFTTDPGPGEIVFIGGKLDTSAPLAGVVGDRVLLGKATFTRTESSMPFTGVVSITYGRGDGTSDFKNFVAVDGTVMDGSVVFDHPTYSVPAKIVELGDVNASGFLSSIDFSLLRSMLRNGDDFLVFADMNGSGFLSSIDLSLLRSKLRP